MVTGFEPTESDSSAEPITCPDCRQGKHGSCEGDAWDMENDRPAICECWRRNHEPDTLP